MVWDSVAKGNYSDSTTETNSNYSSVSKDTIKKNDTLQVDDFLNLLVTELKYQDPLEPTDNSQYIAQMATFTQVQATTEMLDSTNRKMATSLVGKYVSVKTDMNKDGYVTGKVDAWEENSDGIYLAINGKFYDINDLETVVDDDYYEDFLKTYLSQSTNN